MRTVPGGIRGYPTSGPRSAPSSDPQALAPMFPFMMDVAAKLGRGGDRHFVHVNDRELKALRKMTGRKPDGSEDSLNPFTGQPEFLEGESGGVGDTGSSSSPGSGGPGSGSSPGGRGTEGQGPGGMGRGEHGPAATSGVGDGTPGVGGAARDHGADGTTAGNRGGWGLSNPEMGGPPTNAPSNSRAVSHDTVDALGAYGRNVNAASKVAKEQPIGLMDRAKDFFGAGAPGGFGKSSAAQTAVGLLGGMVAGPLGAAVASAAYGLGVRDLSVPDAVAPAIGGMIGGMPGRVAGMVVADAIEGRSTFGRGRSSPSSRSSTSSSSSGERSTDVASRDNAGSRGHEPFGWGSSGHTSRASTDDGHSAPLAPSAPAAPTAPQGGALASGPIPPWLIAGLPDVNLYSPLPSSPYGSVDAFGRPAGPSWNPYGGAYT